MSLLFTNAITDRVDNNSENTLDNLNAGSALAWVYRTTSSTDRFVFCKGRTDLSRAKYLKINSSDNGQGAGSIQLGIYRATTGLIVEPTGTFLPLNTWVCIAATWDTAATDTDQHIYVGSLNSRLSEPGAYTVRQVGSGAVGDDSSDIFVTGNQDLNNLSFAGRIAYLLVWNRVLSLSELRNSQYNPNTAAESKLAHHYNVTPIVPDISGNNNFGTVAGATLADDPVFSLYVSQVMADNPAAYYRMDETSGQPQDSSGNGNHTTVTGGTPTYSQTGAILSDPSSTAIAFVTSPPEYFTAPDHATLDVGDVFTLEAWIKRGAFGAGDYCIVNKGATNGFFFSIVSDFVQLAQAGVGAILRSSTTITDTAWHHVVATKNGATYKIYIDGVDRSGADIYGNKTIQNTNGTFQIGAYVGVGYEFDGSIEEVAVYPTALSAERIRAHYRAGKYYRPSTNVGVRM